MKAYISILFAFLLTSCIGNGDNETLPALNTPTSIKIEQTYPQKVILVINDSEKIESIMNFINERTDGWGVPIYGTPVGQVYFILYDGDEFIGNFYVGPDFFGRDDGNFWSQAATTEEVNQLGLITGVDLPSLVKTK